MFYNALLSKNSDKNKTDEVEKIEDEKYKKLRNLIVKKEKDIKNIIRNKYMIYYFKGKINEMQTNNNIHKNNDNDNEKKDLFNNVNIIENEKNKENIKIEDEKKEKRRAKACRLRRSLTAGRYKRFKRRIRKRKPRAS